MINEVFHVPMSLGGLSNCEARIAEAIEKPYNDTLEEVRRQAVAHADETGWPRGNRERDWLWAFTVCATCRLQNRSIIEYLRHACHNHLNGRLAPDLIVNL